jgi:hypothetical protein
LVERPASGVAVRGSTPGATTVDGGLLGRLDGLGLLEEPGQQLPDDGGIQALDHGDQIRGSGPFRGGLSRRYWFQGSDNRWLACGRTRGRWGCHGGFADVVEGVEGGVVGVGQGVKVLLGRRDRRVAEAFLENVPAVRLCPRRSR